MRKLLSEQMGTVSLEIICATLALFALGFLLMRTRARRAGSSLTARHYIIDTTDPAFAEFESDALHYCESFDLREQPELFGVFMSARATVKAIDAARGSVR